MLDYQIQSMKETDTKETLLTKILVWWYRSKIYKTYQYSWLYDLRWKITHWYRHDNWLKTNLKVGYYDKLTLIEDALFATVENYVSRDGEDAPSYVCIEDEVMDKIINILHFYRIRKPALEAEENRLLHELFGDTKMVFHPIKNSDRSELEMVHGDKYNEEQRKTMTVEMRNLEQKIFDETQEMLKLVIDIRPYLWT